MTLRNLRVLKHLCNCKLCKFSCNCHPNRSNIRILSTVHPMDISLYIAEQWVQFPMLARVLHGQVFLREDCTIVCCFCDRLCVVKQLTKSHIPRFLLATNPSNSMRERDSVSKIKFKILLLECGDYI